MLLTLLISQWFLVFTLLTLGKKMLIELQVIPQCWKYLIDIFTSSLNLMDYITSKTIFFSLYLSLDAPETKAYFSRTSFVELTLAQDSFEEMIKILLWEENIYSKNHMVISKDSFTFTFIVFFFKWIMNLFWTSITSVKFPLKKKHIFNCL